MERWKELQKLTELPLVQSMADDARQRVASLFLHASEHMTLADGDTLLRQGEVGGDAGFVLLEGGVVIAKEGTDPIAVSAPALLGEMYQFNPQAQRTATVSAAGRATVLKFAWRELYDRARQDLSRAEQTALMESIERVVWERFDRNTLMDLALLRGLPDPLRLRVCLLLQWVSQRVALGDGETLFKRDDLCGATGYLLTHGSVEVEIIHHPVEIFSAPDMLGVMPQFDPDLKWSATATAKGDVEVLKFSWLNYMAIVKGRLSPSELGQFNEAVEDSANQHFAH